MPSLLLDSRNDAAHDLPAVQGARAFVVASTPRTGSTLLCRMLWETGRVGGPKEYLNPMQVRDWEVRLGTWPSRIAHGMLWGPAIGLAGRGRWSDDRLRRHLARVRERRSGPSWFGLKVHWHHFERWFLRAGRDPEDFLGPITWVRVGRADRLAQAVSWARALQTGRWAAHQRGWAPPIYSRARIDRCLAAIEDGERGWDHWFARIGVQPLRVDYDDIVQDGVARVLAHLGEGPVAVEPPLRRQADTTSAEWIARWEDGR